MQSYFFPLAFTMSASIFSLILDQCHSCIKIIIAQALIAAAKKERAFNFLWQTEGEHRIVSKQPPIAQKLSNGRFKKIA